MLSAFILIEVEGNHTRSAYKTIQRMDGVRATYVVTGGYDLIVQVSGENLHSVYQALQQIRGVQGITKTTTCIDLNSDASFQTPEPT